MNDPLLKLLQSKARLSNEELAEALSQSAEEVDSRISQWEQDGTIICTCCNKTKRIPANGIRKGTNAIQSRYRRSHGPAKLEFISGV